MSAFVALLRKDLIALGRAAHLPLAVFLFAFVLVVVASMGFRQTGYGAVELHALTPGMVWLLFFFSGVVALNSTAAIEREGEACLAVVLSSTDPMTVFAAKAASNFLFLYLVALLVLISQSILFGVVLLPEAGSVAGGAFDYLLLVALVGIGFSAFGTLISAMAAWLRGREILLPLLLFPLCIPLFAIALQLHRELLEGGSLSLTGVAGVLLLCFDAVAVAVSTVLFEYVVSE